MALTEKHSLTLTLPLVARRIFTSMISSTYSYVISSMAESLPSQAPSASFPPQHGWTITHQLLLLTVCYFHSPISLILSWSRGDPQPTNSPGQ